MLTMNEHHSHPLISIMLWITSTICYMYSSITMETLYTWTFRGLSLLSLILIVVINMPKAINTLKDLFNKK